MKMTDLTDEQQLFVDVVDEEYEAYLQSIEDRKPFSCMLLLNAPGGTGKTFILKYLYKKYKALIIAPTHKATSIFGKAGIPACTIHRFLEAKDDYTEEGELEFIFTAGRADGRIVIVDEASMVSKQMFRQLASINGLVIFAGDKSQINPVGELESPVFSGVSKENTYTLTKNMRVMTNPDSMSANYLTLFREATVKSTPPIRVTRKTTSFMLEQFKKEDDVIALAWTNKRVAYLNTMIRSQLFADGNEEGLEPYYIGEKLVFSGYRKIGGDPPEWYHSSDILVITAIREERMPVQFVTCRHQPDDASKINACTRCDIPSHKSLQANIRFHVMTDQNGVEWRKPIHEDAGKLDRILAQHKKACIKAKSRDMWRSYYEMVNEYNPDINYTYALTVHKAQGSEYSVVFVDIDNIRYNRDNKEQARLAYTAVSRYRKYVFFI